MPCRPTHGSCVNSVEDSIIAQNVSRKPNSRAGIVRVEVQLESITVARTVWGNNYKNQNQGQGWPNSQNQNSQNNQGYGCRNNQNNMPSNRVREPPPEKKVDLEQALAQMLTSHSAFMNETKENMQQQETQLNNQAAHLRNLDVQMGQMANLLTERQPGSLPSNSEVNPRRDGNEHVKAVMLRSGKELETKGQSPVIEEVEIEKVIQPG